MQTIYFVTHPDVVIDPTVPVPNWPLSERGVQRMKQLLTKPWINEIQAIYCSTEQKAIDGAQIVADHLSLPYQQHQALGENDRAATGFLPKEDFERTADQFFANPDKSIRGWEPAGAAQQRIIKAIEAIIEKEDPDQNILIVSHGAVGALYLCHLKGCPITRAEDQPATGGGNYYVWHPETGVLMHDWVLID
ncbi:MAG: histidine phosphatase family protein [Chloroflexota bacterium]